MKRLRLEIGHLVAHEIDLLVLLTRGEHLRSKIPAGVAELVRSMTIKRSHLLHQERLLGPVMTQPIRIDNGSDRVAELLRVLNRNRSWLPNKLHLNGFPLTHDLSAVASFRQDGLKAYLL